METLSLSYSVNWGSDETHATQNYRPFLDDAMAKAARDSRAALLRADGWKVRKRSLKGQIRPYWGWQEPCDLPPCTVYYLDATKGGDC